jgi:hypothetical protein
VDTSQGRKREYIVPEFLDLAKAAKQFGVSTSSLKNWVKSGRLRGYKLGLRKLYVKPEELRALVTEYQLPRQPFSREDLAQLYERIFEKIWGPEWREKLKESRRQGRVSEKKALVQPQGVRGEAHAA